MGTRMKGSAGKRDVQAARGSKAARNARPPRGVKAPRASRASLDGQVATGRVALLVGTVKGAFIYRSNKTRGGWTLSGPHRFGEIINHLVLDPRAICFRQEVRRKGQ